MTAETCHVCEKRPTPDGYACSGCASKAAGHLAAIIELAPDARLVAAGLVRRGRGGGGGKPGSRPPLNDGATDTLDAVTNALTTLAREIADTRGLQIDWDRRTLVDPLVGACSWILGQMEWARHAVDDQGQPYAVAAFDEIAQCAGRIRGLVNGPAEQRYLGPCGAELCPSVYEGWHCERTGEHERHTAGDGGHRNGATWSIGQESEPKACEGDIYGVLGGSVGRCRTCGAEVGQDDRRAWLDDEVRAHAFRAAQIAQAYGVNVNTIRSWAVRGSLKSYFRTDGGIVAEWVDPAEGETRERLHYVGDVLDLAAADAARRAGEQAKRARRAAAREAAEESEDAA